MSSSDGRDEAFDLQLVRSYLPVLLLLLRSVMLVLAAHALAPFLADSGVFVLLSVFVYFDALCFWRDALNRAAGFLLPTAFVVYVNFRGAVSWPANSECERTLLLVPYWAADVAWAASSSVVFVSLCMQVQLRVRIVTVTVAWASMALAHVLLGCLRPYSLAELLGRIVLYYASCAFFFLSSMVLPGIDRNQHSFTVVHVNMHLLFVELSVLAVSVCISAAAYVCIYYQYSVRKGSAGAPKAAGAGAGGAPFPPFLERAGLPLAEARLAAPSPTGVERQLHARRSHSPGAGAGCVAVPVAGPPCDDLLAELRAALAAPRA